MESWNDAEISGSNTPLFQYSNIPAASSLLAGQIFDIDAIPNVLRNAMAWRECGERRLGRRVDAPFGSVAVFFGRRVEIRAAGIGHDGDVAIRLATGCDRPVDLPIIENVDVVIDDDDALHVKIG